MIFAPMQTLFFLLAQADGTGPALLNVAMIGAIIAIVYFLMIKPQKQKEEERQAMLKKIKKNDHVVTTSGIIGVVTSVKDDEVTLRVDDQQNVRVRFRRDAVAGILGGEGGESAAAADDEKKKS